MRQRKDELSPIFGYRTIKRGNIRVLVQSKLLSRSLVGIGTTLWEPLTRRVSVTSKLELWQRPKATDHATLTSYASFLRKLFQTFNAHGFYAELNSTYLVRIAGDKLPWSLKMKWSKHLVDFNSTFPGLEDLSNWMDRQDRACEQLQDSVTPQNQPSDAGIQLNFKRRDKNNHCNENKNHQSLFVNQNKGNIKKFSNRNSKTAGNFRNGSASVNNYGTNNSHRDNAR